MCPAAARWNTASAHATETRPSWSPDDQQSKPLSDLERLAKAKIAACLMMLGGKLSIGNKQETQHERLLWRHWLGTRDFGLWCEAAGYEPQYVHQKAKAIDLGGIDFATSVMASGEWKREQRKRRRANILRRKIDHLKNETLAQ